MLEKLNNDAIHRMDQAVEHVVLELTKIRTGRANPDLLNSIQYLMNKGYLVVVLYLGKGDMPNIGSDVEIYDFREKIKNNEFTIKL